MQNTSASIFNLSELESVLESDSIVRISLSRQKMCASWYLFRLWSYSTGSQHPSKVGIFRFETCVAGHYGMFPRHDGIPSRAEQSGNSCHDSTESMDFKLLSPSLLYVSTEHLLHIQYLSISRRKAGSMPVSLLFIRIQHRADLKVNMESKPEIPLRLASFLFQLFCSGGSNMYLTWESKGTLSIYLRVSSLRCGLIPDEQPGQRPNWPLSLEKLE